VERRDSVTLAPGTRLGPYEIVGLLGTGGMGEVYRALDTRLSREVAVKIVFADPERRSRFEVEARTIAGLTHPHICRLYDVGSQDSATGSGPAIEYLVMELLSGETLASRLVKGPMDVAEALACAMQIAEGLDAAHRAGVIHRDLKPGNVMLTRTGAGKSGAPHAKLLDFGLAKILATAGGEAAAVGAKLLDATRAAPITANGQILGTLPYMAPEQLEGQPIDVRTDIFAFGAIVFESVTGRRAYGATTLAMPGAPPALERLVAVCLSNDPEDRWSTAHDVLLQLRSIAAAPVVTKPAGSKVGRRERLAWGVAAAAVVVALVAAASGLLRAPRGPVDAPLDVLSILPSVETRLERGEAPQISPDGRSIAFVATDRVGKSRLYIRSRDAMDARVLSDTDGAAMPFWSPDNRQLGFFAQGQLKTIAISGGSAHAIAAAPVPRGGTWGRDNLILFVAVPSLPIYRVAAAGGDAVPVLMPTVPEFRSFPSFLADGRHYLYIAIDDRSRTGAGFAVKIASLDSTDTQALTRSTASARLVPGHLLFRRDAALIAQPFDARSLQLSGSPVVVAEDVGFNALTYQGLFSGSENGELTFQHTTPGSQLIWFDRQGGRPVAAAAPADYNAVCLTADEKKAVYDLADPVTGSIDVWALDLASARPSRLTFNPSTDFYPVCSPSGEDVMFASLREGPPNLFRVSLAAPGSERIVLRSPVPKIATDWSRDGKLLVYTVINRKTNSDIEVVPLAGGPPHVVVATVAEESNARLSPDGRWIAYNSNENGGFEVYVQPFPTTGAKWQVSKGGGQQPQWRRDGAELFYITPDRKLTGVAVKTGADFVLAEARVLMDTRITGWDRSNYGMDYAVSADGQRFLINTASDAVLPITLVLNWTAAPGRHMP
jgi:Tol biopolymer transport system component/tRNA A-37 threonylcarbamoyl transferase component Bud32